jgi:hypothetical protein
MRRLQLAACAGAALVAVSFLLAQAYGSSHSAARVRATPAGPSRLGPERVPVPVAPPLAPPGAPRAGQTVDGIASTPVEQLAFHVHAHLTVFIAGAPKQIPAGVGVAPPLDAEPTPAGSFVVGGGAFAWLHTHAADGIVHIESPVQRKYTLGEFFDVWGQPLGRARVGPAAITFPPGL